MAQVVGTLQRESDNQNAFFQQVFVGPTRPANTVAGPWTWWQTNPANSQNIIDCVIYDGNP